MHWKPRNNANEIARMAVASLGIYIATQESTTAVNSAESLDIRVALNRKRDFTERQEDNVHSVFVSQNAQI